MLTAKARSAISWNFTVYEDDVPVAQVDCAWIRERAVLTIAEDKYKAFRSGGAFVLAQGEQVLLRAEEAGFAPGSFEIVYEETVYRLRAKPENQQVYQLAKEGGSVMGTFHLSSVMARKIEAQFPQNLPLMVRVFILWLVILSWKQASRAT